MFKSVHGTCARSRLTITSPTLSHRSSVDSLLPGPTADELVFQECIKIIDDNMEEVIVNIADARESKWWIDENYKIIDGIR